MSWRAKLGIVYPADGALDHEYWELVPGGVTVHITRMDIPQEDGTLEALKAQAEGPEVEKATKNITIIHPDAIAYACTSGSFLHGIGGDLEIIRRMEATAGVSCTTTSTAAVRALKAIEAEKVAIVTPYPDEINVCLKEFMEASGFQVVHFEGLGLYRNIFDQPAGAVYRLVKAADRSEADAIFISCTNFRSVEVLEALEHDLGKPVVSANQATVWDLLRLSNIYPFLEGRGALYRLQRDAYRNK